MKVFSQHGKNCAFAFAVVILGATTGPDAQAQQHCKQSGKNLAADSKFTQQHVIDVGDIPGHQVRIVEVRRTPSNARPNCEGAKVVEQWNRGYSDYTNTNGRAWGYRVVILDSGERIFGQWQGTTHTTLSADGAKKTVFTGTYVITGGTGRYRGIQGVGREISHFDPSSGFNEAEWEEEYWIEQ